MDIKAFFSKITGRSDGLLHTPYGDFNLAKAQNPKTVKSVVIGLQRTTDALTRKDIADWRVAWQMAINVDSPNRKRLYDIYRDVEVDAHLSGCVAQREGFVMAKSFKLVDANGKEDEQALHYFDQAWFKRLCRLVLDSRYWGHSLIELGDVVTDGDGCPCYSRVALIPRKHVIPEYGRVITDLGQDWTTGIDYHEPPFSGWLIEAGQPDDLGLYLKAAQHTIPKKNMFAFWDAFGEIFGMPLRVAKTSTRDEKERKRINEQLAALGFAGSAVLPLDTELEFVESSRGDAFNVYNERVDRANSELSKLIIGQTMTIEDGSSLSQSQTHLQVLHNIIDADADMLRDVVNNQLLPRMVSHGFPVGNLRFEWVDSITYTPDQQVAYETMIADRYDVDPKYFAEKYSMPVGDRRNPTPPIDPGNGDDDGNDGDDNDGNNHHNDPKDPTKHKKAKNAASHPSSSRGYNPASSAASFFD